MTSDSSEQIVIENSFGIVTTKRVTYFAKKGWFGGGRREDVPLRQVVAVRDETDRKVFNGLFLVALGVATVVFIIGIIPLIVGILLIWGSPAVVVTTGGTANYVIGWPWQRGEADEFAKALRNELFKIG